MKPPTIPWLLLLAVALVACSRPAPLTIDALKLPAAADPRIERIDERSVFRDPGGEAQDPGTRAMRAMGVTGSAFYRYGYRLDDDRRASLKVKINLYRDRAAALADWQHRYPESLARHGAPVDYGQPSLGIGDRMVAFVECRVLVEVTEPHGSALVADLARRYHRHVQQHPGNC